MIFHIRKNSDQLFEQLDVDISTRYNASFFTVCGVAVRDKNQVVHLHLMSFSIIFMIKPSGAVSATDLNIPTANPRNMKYENLSTWNWDYWLLEVCHGYL